MNTALLTAISFFSLIVIAIFGAVSILGYDRRVGTIEKFGDVGGEIFAKLKLSTLRKWSWRGFGWKALKFFFITGLALLALKILSFVAENEYTKYLYKCIMVLAAWGAIQALVNRLCPKEDQQSTRMGYIVATIVTASWLIFPNWIILNLAAAAIAVTALLLFQRVKLLHMPYIAVSVGFFDAVAVFGTEYMERLAKKVNELQLPLILRFPQEFAWSSEAAIGLGLGDVIFPGLFILVAARLTKKQGKWYILAATIVGYIVGLAAAIYLFVVHKYTQPATIYLFPAAFLGLAIALKAARIPLRAVARA